MKEEMGASPGNGITPKLLSKEPLATEGEATHGPDDYNPYEEEPENDPEPRRPLFAFGGDPEAEGADGDWGPEPAPLFADGGPNLPEPEWP